MKKITLKISDELYDQLEKVRQQSGLHSLTDFILAILQEYVDQRHETSTEAKDESEIRKRLENLGYL